MSAPQSRVERWHWHNANDWNSRFGWRDIYVGRRPVGCELCTGQQQRSGMARVLVYRARQRRLLRTSLTLLQWYTAEGVGVHADFSEVRAVEGGINPTLSPSKGKAGAASSFELRGTTEIPSFGKAFNPE